MLCNMGLVHFYSLAVMPFDSLVEVMLVFFLLFFFLKILLGLYQLITKSSKMARQISLIQKVVNQPNN